MLDLSTVTTADLKKMRRNALAQLERFPGTAKAEAAEQRVAAVEAELDARSLPGSIASFLEAYPQGFHDVRYAQEEGTYKRDASRACRTLLSRHAFIALDEGGSASLLDAVKLTVSMTSLLDPRFERPKLLDGTREPKASISFLRALRELLHGEGETPERLEQFSDYMHTIGLRKWTYGTYFLFLHDPGACMFVKPESIKKAADIAGFDIGYEARPTAHGYRTILTFARSLEGKLRANGNPHLHPTDMIDVQSFIWHMAPTGKWSK